MFYEIYANLCKEKGKSPSRVALELGINKSTVSVWKSKGTTPQTEILQKIADYFGVSLDYLLETKKTSAEPAEDQEMTELLEALKNNPGMRVLFSKTKNATKEDIEKVIKMLEIMKGDV